MTAALRWLRWWLGTRRAVCGNCRSGYCALCLAPAWWEEPLPADVRPCLCSCNVAGWPHHPPRR